MAENSFSSKNRAGVIRQMHTGRHDLLVIGGGITGAGIALDAAARGLKVLLLDMQDFAGGTSSRSTKLIHGGLRYLKQLEFKLVAEVGKERAIIHRNAPQLSIPEAMLLPITKNGSFGRLSTAIGMRVYEWLAGVKPAERHQMLNAKQSVQKEPLLGSGNLLGSALFYEYRTDDARLTIEVLKEAVNRGALAINYMKVTAFNYQSGKISGVQAQDVFTGTAYEVQADYVINASGPWVDMLDSMDDKKNAGKLQLTKGVHLVFDHKKLPVQHSLYIDTFDHRMIFLIPRNGKVYVGTTDTFYDGDKVDPKITADDRNYLLKCLSESFPGLSLTKDDIESGWAGLRPLISKPGKKPSEISRKDETFVWPSGLITIAGGKLTGYRKMAERVVNRVADQMRRDQNKKIPASSTATIVLSGGSMKGFASFGDFLSAKVNMGVGLGLQAREARLLAHRYGANIDELYKIISNLESGNSLPQGLPPVIAAEILYCMEHEMCYCPGDFFIRRTGMLYFEIAAVRALSAQTRLLMQEVLEWPDELAVKFDSELTAALAEAG